MLWFKNYTWLGKGSKIVRVFIKRKKIQYMVLSNIQKGSRYYNFKKDSSLFDCLKRTKERIELTEN